MTFYRGDPDPLRLSIDVCNRHRPERNQIDSWHELDEKRRQKLPVPAEKVSQHGPNSDIEDVIGGRFRAFDEQGKNGDLENIRNDRQYEGGSKTRAWRDGYGAVSQSRH